jgi:hypothetical protein
MSTNQTDEYFDGISWAVPVAFAEPLAACRFEQGDILYDTRQAYDGTWGEALPHIKHSIQVKLPMRGTGTKSEKEEESVFTDNWNMTVVFTLTDCKAKKTKEITTTQGRLYSLLWKGDLGSIDANSSTPPLPTLAMEILRDLPNAEGHIKKNAAEVSQSRVVFLMPFDRTRQLLRIKFRKVEEVLARFKTHTCSISPAKAGLQTATDFAPTVSIACFAVQDGSVGDVEKALKQALYTPSKDKKTDKELFRVSAHGHLFAK